MQTLPSQHLRVLVGISEIANLTHVAIPVVTNWRGRFPSFPRPAVAGARPQFDLALVLRWLDSGDGPAGRSAPEIPPETWWRLTVRAFALEVSVAPPRQTLAALLVLHHHLLRRGDDTLLDDIGHDNDKAFAKHLRARAERAEADDPALRGLLLGSLGNLDPTAAAYVGDMIRVLALDGWSATPLGQLSVILAATDDPAGPDRTTTDVVATVMAALAAVRPGDVVLDPACGEGGALLACAVEADGQVQLYGQELDEGTWRIARARLFLAGLDPSGLAPPGFDSLREDQHRDLGADVVVLDPPVNESKAPLSRWIPHALGHIGPGGRAVIALPLSSVVPVRAARRKPDDAVVEQLRALADDRRLQAAVVLPRGHRGDVVGPIVLLVIGAGDVLRHGDQPMVVGMIDTHDAGDLEPGVTRQLAELVSRDGVAGLGATAIAPLSVATAETFNDALQALDEAGSEAESGITRGPRRSAQTEASVPAVDRSESRLRDDVEALVRRIDSLRPLVGEAVYGQLVDELERVKRRLSER
jgi:hypothetical protein